MLTALLDRQVAVGLGQAGGAIILCLLVVALCRHYGVRVGRETSVSLLRGLVQMALVGVVLGLVIGSDAFVGVAILCMLFAIALTFSQRAKMSNALSPQEQSELAVKQLSADLEGTITPADIRRALGHARLQGISDGAYPDIITRNHRLTFYW